MRLTTSLLTAAALAAAFNAVADAAEVYRWVDADGVVHYSDEKPDEPFTTLQLDDTRPADYDPAQDFYSIVNQAKRLNDAWIDLAAARQEREQLRLEQAASSVPYEPAYEYDPYAYRPGVLYYPPVVSHRPFPIRRPKQLPALAELDLLGPRPHSINSGAHRERVERSAILPILPTHGGRHR